MVLLTGEGKHFCSGLDLADAATNLFSNLNDPNSDVGRKAIKTYSMVREMQDNLSAAENCRAPVIVAI